MIDERMPWLLSKLVDAGVGRMAVIIGGGPSVKSDLKQIPGIAQALIISANEHAFHTKLRADYIWCKDHRRIFPGWQAKHAPKEFMEPRLRKYGVPIVGPNYWCDYRAIEWPLPQFNSGQQAIAFAALLGCAPIVAVGMDCFEGATYFHDPDAPNISKGRPRGYWVSRLERLRQALPSAPIRGCSGILRATFGAYNPAKHPVPGPVPAILHRYVKMPTLWVRTRREFQDAKDKFAIIPKGYVIPTNAAEGGRLIKTGLAERVELFHA